MLKTLKKVWVIGGTSESREIVTLLVSRSIPCLVTVTTEAARSLYPPSPGLDIRTGRLTPDRLEELLCWETIAAVVDASHPYASSISHHAIAITAQFKIPYLRYERPALATEGEIVVESFQELLSGDYLCDRRVLLTVGCKTLPLFQPWHDRATLFARVLPVVNSLEVAIAAGFSPHRLIALRPPLSGELEEALWRQWHIDLVVTKASGREGGEEIKRSVAAKLGIPLLVVARPFVSYPQQTANLEDVFAFCDRHLK
ncbi:cobalt-precorrin-6A reductase [Spirulina sp. 06S082]|uniref:cobalt-precorrin-6A reductase n=1 Tax=Spirulina sp. 06S082 TaxID=3110248 RepID=UPI002B220FC7|nr:cobalt-precorrin-6A reductase [Spirulina sp. 06S082]MEA5468035.1 cobalt-precorrin-6A reductase [Spirulina sp. 06S082]